MRILNWTKLLAVSGAALLLGVGGASAETLRGAVSTTLLSHPELRKSIHTQLAREERINQEKAGYYPQLDFTARYGVQEKQEPVDETLYPLFYTLSLRQNIYGGGATKGEVERETLWAQSLIHDAQANAEFLGLRTADVYLKVLRQQQLLRLAEENLETHLRIGDQIKLRSDAGVNTSTDTEQVTGRVALAQANVVAAKINLADAETNYQAVVGVFPENLEEPGPVSESLPSSIESAEELAIAGHPTLMSANVEIETREKQHDVAKAPYLPIVDLEVDQNWTEDYDREGKDNELIVMVRLRQNIFNGYQDAARRNETKQLVHEAREIRNNTQRQVVESIRLSWMAHEAYQERATYLEERIKATIATADSYSKQFNLGKRTLLDVLDTEAEVIEAKKALVEARYDGLYAQYRILNGLGILLAALEAKPEVEIEHNEQTRRIVINQEVLTIEESVAPKP